MLSVVFLVVVIFTLVVATSSPTHQLMPSRSNDISCCRYYYEKCPEVVSEQKTVYVEIALYLINLHSVDLKAGTFHADFYLYFKGLFILSLKQN